ncbi:pantothenate type iii [Leptolyngbya sp. Heron Island J]|uniref:pantothenate kinase n=1 Tax=Leptolyngbya sp. Heron Island J TaxID=1385935 RepID=UPI0003B9D449|nr:pantothenate kinase [Leptolyngbya sp. Heron Island J]ESA37541.1 pantothenate type iii [Leptolyngbya sp. Heron Island J]
MANWLALVIGNTRWHWAWFQHNELKQVWHTHHLISQQPSALALHSMWVQHRPPQMLDVPIEMLNIMAISVVPNQTQCLAHLTNIQWINDFPLKGVYSTMGLDRVATLWGAGRQYGWPVLVIDSGTALTFTAGTADTFMGGAILLGLRSHLAALHHYTATLPKVEPPLNCPPQWATDTTNAIQSGVVHTVLASIHHFIQSWQQQYPNTALIFTGGDGQYLHQLYQQHYPTNQNQVPNCRTWFDPNLMFWGISAYRSDETRAL